MKTLLVTTADETTWEKNKTILFLGDWCKKYSRKHIWENLDYKTVKPYGNSIEIKNKDFNISQILEKELQDKIGNILNKYHKINFNKQMWTLMIGPWIRRYSSLIINRVNVLMQCFDNNVIDQINFKKINIEDIIKENSKESVDAFENIHFNQYLNQEIIKILKPKPQTYKILKNIKNEKLDNEITNKFKIKTLFKYLIFKFLKITNYLSLNNKVATINIYLNFYDFFKMNFYLKTFPYFRTQEKIKIRKKIDKDLRNKLTKELISINNNPSVEDIAKFFVFHFLPICYLEGFKELGSLTDKYVFPKNPKLIITSVNCDTDEVFKLWCANKLISRTKLIIYQHGSNYGTEKNDNNPSIDEMSSNYFINWGWSNFDNKYIPSQIMNKHNLNGALKKRNNKKKIYLIENLILQSYRTYDVYKEFENYFYDQKKFVSNLKNPIKKHLTIKLHSGYNTYNNCEELIRWKDYDSDLSVDVGKIKFKKVINSSKIIIFSYDSTGFLECLSYNIPCVAFWQNNLEHIRKEAKPYYEELNKANLLFFSPDSVASHVNKVYEDVDSWWCSDKIQKARKLFCEKYANRNNPDIISIVSKILNKL